MSLPFVTRPPTYDEIERIRLAMSSFCDGSGQEREGDCTRPGWRDFERIIASHLNGFGAENKEVFDVIVPSNQRPGIDYGISIKSKELGRNSALEDLANGGRVYMELSNSPAKFWAALEPKGIHEDEFRKMQRAADIGSTVLDVVSGWHEDARKSHSVRHRGHRLDLEKSIYLTISYSRPKPRRQYQIHSFGLTFPSGIKWKFISSKCLRGYDPKVATEPLIDWYALSGGQLKYYPRGIDCRYSSRIFSLATPPVQSIPSKAARYWPETWVKAKGKRDLTPAQFSEEMARLSSLLTSEKAKKIIEDAVKELQKL